MMEININLNIDISNFNQIIDKLYTLTKKETNTQGTIPSRNKQDLIDRPIDAPKENIDLTKIREKLACLLNNDKISVAQQLLKKYNAKKITDVKVEDYENLYKEIINQID